MKARFRQFWASQPPRDRIIVFVLAVVVGAALYLWLVRSADRARLELRSTVTALRAQAVRLEQQAAEFERLRAAPATPASQSDLRTLVQAQAGSAGLSRALVRIDAPDANRVQVVFGAVPFADWVAWVAGLQSQHVRLDSCRIEALSTPGLVTATATFVRGKPQ